jgi:Ser/Thr protein kinase RdoA (MazF antagonist)
MSVSQMPLAQLLVLLEKLANQSLELWDMPKGSEVRLINVSENATYLVQGPDDYKAILRIHRENYHSRRAIECELEWLRELEKSKVVPTPGFYIGKNGSPIQMDTVDGLPEPRYMVLFEFVQGDAPDETGDMIEGFVELGAIAARCHEHVLNWKKPEDFERLTWDVNAVFGQNPVWGNWRDAPEVDSSNGPILEKVEKTIGTRLDKFGQSYDRFNLIHADMRLANLLVGIDQTRLIDFDDSGWGWFMYDFAAAISFIEDDPRIPKLKEAWVRGYGSVRELSIEQEAEIDTFVMLRRMALLAWIGSHIEAPEPQELAPGFASTTARLGQIWMDNLDDNDV